MYDDQHVWRLEFIARAKQLGFTLTEITELFGDERERTPTRCSRPPMPSSPRSRPTCVSSPRAGAARQLPVATARRGVPRTVTTTRASRCARSWADGRRDGADRAPRSTRSSAAATGRCWSTSGLTWCAPCRQFDPVLTEVAGRRGDVLLASVDIDGNPELVLRFGVMSAPTLVLVVTDRRGALAHGWSEACRETRRRSRRGTCYARMRRPCGSSTGSCCRSRPGGGGR